MLFLAFFKCCLKFIPAIFAMHLAPIIIEFSVGATSQAWNSPTTRIAMFGGLAMPTVHSHDPLPKIVLHSYIFVVKVPYKCHIIVYRARSYVGLGFAYLEKVLLRDLRTNHIWFFAPGFLNGCCTWQIETSGDLQFFKRKILEVDVLTAIVKLVRSYIFEFRTYDGFRTLLIFRFFNYSMFCSVLVLCSVLVFCPVLAFCSVLVFCSVLAFCSVLDFGWGLKSNFSLV